MSIPQKFCKIFPYTYSRKHAFKKYMYNKIHKNLQVAHKIFGKIHAKSKNETNIQKIKK